MDLGRDFCINCWWNINSEGIKPKYFAVFDGERVAQVCHGFKKAKMIVEHCHALMYDTNHEQIDDLLNELNNDRSRRRDQVNEHKFKVGNRLRVHGGGGDNGYCVRVTPKFVFFVSEPDIFKHRPFIRRVGNDDGVMHVRPYYGVFDETVQNQRTWLSLTQEFPYSD